MKIFTKYFIGQEIYIIEKYESFAGEFFYSISVEHILGIYVCSNFILKYYTDADCYYYDSEIYSSYEKAVEKLKSLENNIK